ncbi:fructose-bisphosphate aldolase [Aspergillus steynii IBT 23096]|uniref:Fructose-bisphosphate aldolase n=1 Tax=Aspergillus steynii IBT 23096 TaxID=1392250 RepID=A0A2I2GHX9_9EURO|nr:fructose-bisphosphate aldolase [Aspergillus steynii IBT 23096]PLB52480.1 fructose-bisphosphate aldolase [Aspergillus steynii IBT 23096]
MDDYHPEKNKTCQILKDAERGGYGVLATIAYNIENVLGFIRAAEIKRSPLIIQLFPWAVRFSNGHLVHFAAAAAREASVPIAIHMDHCQDELLIRHAAANLPFDSIMIDLSHCSKEDNLRKTAELVKVCHEHHKSAEAEPGRIEGGEDGISNTADLGPLMTTPGEVQDFVDTGVDFLAPSFGNVHGEYGARGIQLDWERLDSIQSVAAKGDVRIVLHGVNNFNAELIRRLISRGVTKVNVNKDILKGYYRYLEDNVSKVPFTSLMENGVAEVTKGLEIWMDMCLSTGKAPMTASA